MSRPARSHRLTKGVRDGARWHVPWLQTAIGAAARRGYVPPQVWRRLQPHGLWCLHAPDGTPFTYDCDHRHDGLARHIVWTDLRHWEAGTQPVLFALAKEAEVFIDIGAYSGIYTLLACIANARLRAVAFEPNPGRLQQLRANVNANGLRDRVTVIGKALSAESGTARLTIPADDSTASLGSPRPGDRVVEVTVTTGDHALGDLPVGLVKINVAGFETEVLMGMSRILTTHRPKVIAECLDREALRRLYRMATQYGYRHAYHLGRERLVPVGEQPFRPANFLFSTEPMGHR